MRFIFDVYMVHLHYVFSYYIDVIVVGLITCVMSMLMINIINYLSIFKLKLRFNTHLNLEFPCND